MTNQKSRREIHRCQHQLGWKYIWDFFSPLLLNSDRAAAAQQVHLFRYVTVTPTRIKYIFGRSALNLINGITTRGPTSCIYLLYAEASASDSPRVVP